MGSSLHFHLLAFLVLGVLGCLAVLWESIPLLSVKGAEQTSVSKPSMLAERRLVSMHIENTVRYQPDTIFGEEEFARLLPTSGHLVYAERDEKPQTVALFHQLRCLDIIRKDYTDRSGASMLGLHCLNYLRQSILCLADTRLESVRSPVGPHVVSFSSDYVCEDWTAVYAAAEKRNGAL